MIYKIALNIKNHLSLMLSVHTQMEQPRPQAEAAAHHT